jgi:hypothetical protein
MDGGVTAAWGRGVDLNLLDTFPDSESVYEALHTLKMIVARSVPPPHAGRACVLCTHLCKITGQITV